MITFLKLKLQNKALRWICILLAAVAVFGVIGTVTGAFKQPIEEEEDDDELQVVPPDVDSSAVILFVDCEPTTLWWDYKIGGYTEPMYDYERKTQGSSSVGDYIGGVDYSYSAGVFRLNYVGDPVDITDMTHVAFDIYVENPSCFNGNHFSFEIGSSNVCDEFEIQASNQLFEGLVEGWNTIEIDISEMREYGFGFDPTHVIRVRIYNSSGNGIVTGDLLFDNFRFVKK